jgi:hypothetical protein
VASIGQLRRTAGAMQQEINDLHRAVAALQEDLAAIRKANTAPKPAPPAKAAAAKKST